MYFTFDYGELKIEVSTIDDSEFIELTIKDATLDLNYSNVMPLTKMSELNGKLSVLIENIEIK